MKNSKNLLMMIFVFVFSLLLVGVMNVSASIGFANEDPVCDPKTGLKSGETTKCYLRGTAKQTADTNKVHGFVTRLYTTDGLRFDSVEPYIDGTDAVALAAGANSLGSFAVMLEGSKELKFDCSFNAEIGSTNPKWNYEDGDDYRCALFYSNTVEPAITVKSGEPKDDALKELVGTGNGIMVIGIVNAHIDQNPKEDSSCGELCVFTKEAPTLESYKLEGTDSYACTEVHFTKTGTPAGDTPTTGAFTSYALLAAGALIAISAVAIAKKHNKFYRV